MPALVKSTLGSSLSTSGALGRRICPFASKNLKNFSRIVELSSRPSPYEKTRGDHTVTPRVPLPY